MSERTPIVEGDLVLVYERTPITEGDLVLVYEPTRARRGIAVLIEGDHVSVATTEGTLIAPLTDVRLPSALGPEQVVADAAALAGMVNPEPERAVATAAVLRRAVDVLGTTRERALAEGEAAHAEWKANLAEAARVLARQHDWCEVVDRFLNEQGLTRQRRFKITVEIIATGESPQNPDGSERWWLQDSVLCLPDNDDDGSSVNISLDSDWTGVRIENAVAVEAVYLD